MKMTMNKLIGSLIAVFVGIVLFAPGHTLAAAFGVSPPWIENENLKPGSNFVYVINLSANELSEDMIVHSEFEGDSEITKWLTIQDKNNLVMTKGQSIVPMSVTMNIPENAKVGKYQGNLKLSISPKDGSIANNAVLLGGNIAIKLNVIDYDVTDYWVQKISVDPISEGQAIDLKIGIKNLGNINVTSVMTKASVLDMKTGAKVTSGSADKLSVPVYPHTIADVGLSVLVPDLKAGNYWLDVESFKDGKSIYENRLYFTVEPPIISNTVDTAVDVAGEGWIKPAAPEESQLGSIARVQTSVKVRAPLTNQLIVVIIGILLVMTGIVAKIYVNIRKKRR